MKPTEYFNFTLPPNAWSKRPYVSRRKMTIEQATKDYPGAQPILASREVRPSEPTTLHRSPPMPGSVAWKELHPDE